MPRHRLSPIRLLLRLTVLVWGWTSVAAGNPFEAAEPNILDAPQVPQWDRFEVTVANEVPYADPYSEVTLDVTYTRPDGSMVDFWGFYDGGTEWRLRFMPDLQGIWQYRASFSDGQPAPTGTFACIPSTIPGQLSADDANALWFGFKGGGHVLVRSFHVGDRFFAANWPPASRAAFLDWAQAQGYNMLSIASHYLNRDVPGRGRGWDTPALWPLDAVEYQQLERILDDLAERRILVFPFAGFFGRSARYPSSPSDQQRYLRYTLARLGAYWNILLNVAGPEPNLDDYLRPDEVAGLGDEIGRLDVFHHPLAVHNRAGNDPYRNSEWSTYGIVQGPKTTDPASLGSALVANHHPTKPLYAHEVLWPGNKNQPRYTTTDVRRLAYVVNMSAATLNFGDMNGDSSSGFSGTMDLSDRVQVRHDVVKRVWDYFEEIPFYRMRPCPELVSRGHCLADVGREYLVYLDSAGTVDAAVTGGPYAVEWVNARRPEDRRFAASTTTTGRGLTAPGSGDWLLHLRQVFLQVSAAGDRSAAVPLEGQVLAGNAHVFVIARDEVDRVRFYLDDAERTRPPRRLENLAPYDFAGTDPNGTARPYDTRRLRDGAHVITAAVAVNDGTERLVHARFLVANTSPPAEPPVSPPFALTFTQDQGGLPDRKGVGTGFTRVDPPTTGAGYLPGNLDVDMTAGVLRLTTSAGIAFLDANSLDNALAVGVLAAQQPLVVETTLVDPPPGSGRFEQGGLWFGNDQDNYVKLVAISTPEGTRIQHLSEVGGVVSADRKSAVLDLTGRAVLLRLRLDPSSGVISSAYGVGDGAVRPLATFIGPPELFGLAAAGADPATAPPSLVGVFASHRSGPAPLVFAFAGLGLAAAW